jgi:hypothetical protein
MRFVFACLFLPILLVPASAQEQAGGPSTEKAQKSYKEALEHLKQRREFAALESFKKADKQDGGHCLACQKQMIKYGVDLGEYRRVWRGRNALVGPRRPRHRPRAL